MSNNLKSVGEGDGSEHAIEEEPSVIIKALLDRIFPKTDLMLGGELHHHVGSTICLRILTTIKLSYALVLIAMGGCIDSVSFWEVPSNVLNQEVEQIELFTKHIRSLEVEEDEKQVVVTERAMGDVLLMGLGNITSDVACEMTPYSSKGIKLKDNRFRMKYASIADLEDKDLSTKETRKRDHALKRYKKFIKENFPRELFDHPPTNSDIARKKILTKSARRIHELGKKVGFMFMGEKKEVVIDIVRLESHYHM
ncbi:hypothetical protein V6N13_073980 [Hibiscus sabdariffa]|uniref:Uncharacterized protein n=1 Tax=Hibiscus sabdariffa TaxID=183260 RepID=A0ABR2U7F5_9ROSI